MILCDSIPHNKLNTPTQLHITSIHVTENMTIEKTPTKNWKISINSKNLD
jgi:hypothetical protein